MIRSHAPELSAVARLQLLVLGIAVAAAAAAVAWLALHNASSPKALPASLGPQLVSQTELAALADALDRPIYWAGPRSKFAYELTLTAAGASTCATCPAAPPLATHDRASSPSARTPARTPTPNLKKVSTGAGGALEPAATTTGCWSRRSAYRRASTSRTRARTTRSRCTTPSTGAAAGWRSTA